MSIIAYIFISIGTVFCGSYVDQPLQQTSENEKVSDTWGNVSEYHILKEIFIGEDAESFSGQSTALNQSFYDWYSSISETKGVYLIHTEHFGEDVLSTWRNDVYASTPDRPFCYFTVSPSYLSEIGLEVNDEELRSARAGTRLYLLPSRFQSPSVIRWQHT